MNCPKCGVEYRVNFKYHSDSRAGLTTGIYEGECGNCDKIVLKMECYDDLDTSNIPITDKTDELLEILGEDYDNNA